MGDRSAWPAGPGASYHQPYNPLENTPAASTVAALCIAFVAYNIASTLSSGGDMGYEGFLGILEIIGVKKVLDCIGFIMNFVLGRRFPGAQNETPRSSERPPGLVNTSNSCYQNSILQGLASLETLVPFLTRTLKNHTADQRSVRVAEELMKLLVQLRDTNGRDGRRLRTPTFLRTMSSFTQQDAQEYYQRLLDDVGSALAIVAAARQGESGDSIHDDISEGSVDSGYHSLSSAASRISTMPKTEGLANPLEGFMAQRVSCLECEYTDGISCTLFNCITIGLETNRLVHHLDEMLDAYTELEPVNDVECARCTLKRLYERLKAEKNDNNAERLKRVELALSEEDFSAEALKECGVEDGDKARVRKTKQVGIARTPRSLVFHINRSIFDEQSGRILKNARPVRFPTTLDLAPWCIGSAIKNDGSTPDTHMLGEMKWPTRPRESMVPGSRNPSHLSGPLYRLRAVVAHQGLDHHSGHYVCYRKHGADPDAQKTWWGLSDATVMPMEEETVLGQGSRVFMLFYDRVDESIVSTSSQEEDTSDQSEAADASYVPTAVLVPLPESDDEGLEFSD